MPQTRPETQTTTVRLPRAVYDQAKSVVSTTRMSLNDLMVAAIETYLKMYQRRQIDAAFAGMAEDADYQKEARLLAEDFHYSDWEALRLGEQDLEGEPDHAASSTR